MSTTPAPPPAGQDDNLSSSKPKIITNPRRLLILTPTLTATTNNTAEATATAPAPATVTAADPINTIPPFLAALTGEPVNHDCLAQVPVNTGPSTTSTSTSTSNPETQTQTQMRPSFAGYTTHAPLRISTRYYTADVPIWVDEIPYSGETEESSSFSETTAGTESENKKGQWETEFLSDEAQVVRDAIGALLVCARNPVAPSRAVPSEAYVNQEKGGDAGEKHAQVIKNTVRVISGVKQKTEEERDGGMGEVPGLLVLLDENASTKDNIPRQEEDDELEVQEVQLYSAAWWEDTLYDMGILGFEVVVWDLAAAAAAEKRNEFGELQGLPRIKEVLAALEWGSASGGDDDDDDDADFLADIDEEVGQLEREMMGLRFAINNTTTDYDRDHDNGDRDEIHGGYADSEDLEALMLRMRAIKDMSADLPEAQRKAFAAKAVRDLMREL